MRSLKFVLLAVTLVTVTAYGPPKKQGSPPIADKSDTIGSIADKDDIKEQDDVLYVKGQPVEGGKEDLADDAYGGKYGGEKKFKEVKEEESGLDLGPAGYGGKPGKGGHGKSYTKEVKEVKYDVVEDKGKFGPEEGKYEDGKDEGKLDGDEYGKEFKEEKKGPGYDSYGGFGGKKEIVKEEVIKEDVGYGGAPKKDTEGGYLPEAPRGDFGGYAKGGKKYGGEEKYEEPVKEEDYPPVGPKGPYGGGKKVTKVIKEEVIKDGGYGIEPKGEYGPKGGFGEEKIDETFKEGGDVKPKGGYGYEETKEIKTTKFGGGRGYGSGPIGPKDEKIGDDYEGGYDNKKPITTISTVSCNKMMDGLLGKLQHSFVSHMSSYKVDNLSPMPIGGWARVRMYDGKFDKIGQICRGGDFQVLPQGENVVIRGTIIVPEPKAKFCGDAYLYNRLKVRNRNLALCAKEASFRVQMIVNKRLHKVDVDELEPVGINGFHIEDDKGLRSGALAWPFNKIRDNQLGKQKYQFMSQLQHKLCDDFRQIVAKPEIKEEIVRLV